MALTSLWGDLVEKRFQASILRRVTEQGELHL